MVDTLGRLLSISDEMLCTADQEGFFVALSPTWELVLGWSLDELRAQPFVEFVHPDDREGTLAAAARLSGGSDVVHFENRYRCKDGSWRRLAWRSLAPQAPGEPIVAAARDITDDDVVDAAEFDVTSARREALSAAISTPIIQVWDEIVTMPVVGLVDSVRAADMKTALLAAVSRIGAKFAIVDLTGVETVDTATADHLLRVMKAVQLLGARCVITGIQPSVAQIIIGLGLDLPGVTTLRSLREGLRYCLRHLGFKVVRGEPENPREPT